VSRWLKIVIAVVVVIAVALTLNTITVNNETKAAGVNAEGGQILNLSSGDVQVVETEAQSDKPGAPIVLLHCYACSLHWWDSMVPLLSKDHRVITVDLLGFGGSEKPSGGYSMEDQAGLVAEALSQLQVQGAVVVGHSMGAAVATALAEQSSELVDRVVNIDQVPDSSYGDFPFLAKLGYVPVLGQLLNRVIPDSAVKDTYEDAFAPGYDISSGFENDDQVVDDFNAMTYTSYKDSAQAEDDYTDEVPLDERLKDAAVPLLVIFGAEDQIAKDPTEALAAFEDVPGARTATIDDAGHSPNVEQPEQTADLVLEFAADAGDEVLAPAPESPAGGGSKQGKHERNNQEVRGNGRHAGQKEEHQDEAPNASKHDAGGGGGGGGGPKPGKGQKPPSDQRPGGNQTD
jgi:pimeloyl-ACP methyl ester carboxylesterase